MARAITALGLTLYDAWLLLRQRPKSYVETRGGPECLSLFTYAGRGYRYGVATGGAGLRGIFDLRRLAYTPA
jgi:hypothetical protein